MGDVVGQSRFGHKSNRLERVEGHCLLSHPLKNLPLSPAQASAETLKNLVRSLCKIPLKKLCARPGGWVLGGKRAQRRALGLGFGRAPGQGTGTGGGPRVWAGAGPGHSDGRWA